MTVDLRRPRSLVARLWRAQEGKCFHCGNTMVSDRAVRRGTASKNDRWTREHIFPRSSTGTHLSNNIALAHRSCNSARGDREPTEAEIERAFAIYRTIGEIAFLDSGLVSSAIKRALAA